MGGIYPHQWDGGIPPLESSPDNPPQAFEPKPANQPVDTTALYYGLGCDVRLRAPVLNSIISEITATCDRAGIAYEAALLRNLLTAICQLGGWSGMATRIAAARFTVMLDPPPPRYRNFMRLILVADQANTAGTVRINVNGLGEVPLLGPAGGQLAAGALRQGIPFVCCYFDETETESSVYDPNEIKGRFYKVSA